MITREELDAIFGPVDTPGWSWKAWMSESDADALERLVLDLPPDPCVVEWGFGRSSVYFSRLLVARAPFHAGGWISIEHDERWAMRAWTPPPGAGLLERLLPRGAACIRRPLDDAASYTEMPPTAHADLAIVDGRLRRRCLLSAARQADLVVLHDADRTYYAPAFSAYAYHARVGELLWLGAQDEARFTRARDVVSGRR